MNKRPIKITILGWLFLCVGGASIAKGVVQIAGDVGNGTTTEDVLWILGSGVLAAVSGAFLLRGSSWARWLCAAWLGAHVGLSLMHSTAELVVHAVFFAVIVALLWRPGSSAYFEESTD